MSEVLENITKESFEEKYSVTDVTSYISVENFLSQKYGFVGFTPEEWMKELEVLEMYWVAFKQSIDLSTSNIVMYRDEQDIACIGLISTKVDVSNYTFTQFGYLSHTIFSFLNRENK